MLSGVSRPAMVRRVIMCLVLLASSCTRDWNAVTFDTTDAREDSTSDALPMGDTAMDVAPTDAPGSDVPVDSDALPPIDVPIDSDVPPPDGPIGTDVPDGGDVMCPTGQTACSGICTDTSTDHANCGRCSGLCGPAFTCIAGMCTPFASTGAEGALNVTTNTTLAPGVHNYTTITVVAGVTLSGAPGSAVYDLRATGVVQIDGTIDLSGGQGGMGSALTSGIGGGNGGNVGMPSIATFQGTGMGGLGGFGGGSSVGNAGSSTLTALAGRGGTAGGGGGAAGSGTRSAGGGGGAGPAGGGGGAGYSETGGCSSPIAGAMGGNGTGAQGGTPTFAMSGGHGGSSGITVFNGTDGGSLSSGAGTGTCTLQSSAGGGGGGSIGTAAANDPAVGAATFIPGSSGGGGGNGAGASGGGGGGGGGALRIASPVAIHITGTVRANGGVGGAPDVEATIPTGSGGGGGGSGGVIYLSAPTIEITSTASVSVTGGAGGTRPGGVAGGTGGLGRLRISVDPGTCTIATGTLHPAGGCSSASGTRGLMVSAWPN